MSAEARLWAPRAWVGGAWRESVLLAVAANGCWSRVDPDSGPAPEDAIPLAGPVLPGLVNAHSHAFQRAFAGHAEHRQGEHDDFWSWRERMYAVANRIEPDELRAMTVRLYTEMLRGGYTQVCEFHYLQHAPDGSRYADPLATSRALAEAATQVGIGLTLLPVLYERAGFSAATLRDDQRRFATTVSDVIALRDGVRALASPLVTAGVAIHSLRAARPESIAELAQRCVGDLGPIHIHVAEQKGEVDDCLGATGKRPIEWLAGNVALDRRWQLVHATHATPQEIASVASTGAGVVLCPTTEANLGDGVPDLPGLLAAGVPIAIGSDSQVTRDWREELRLLEYGQRLLRQQRNISATTTQSTAARLFERGLQGGAAAAGVPSWGLVTGARADLVVADPNDDALRDVPAERLMDALVFVSPSRPFRDVMVGGRWRVRNHVAPERRRKGV